MLSKVPRTKQSWTYRAWSGTPDDLAMLAEVVAGLLPDGEFSIEVELRSGEKRGSDDPRALRNLAPRTKVEIMRIETKQYEEGSGWVHVLVRLGRIRLWCEVDVTTANELRTRTLLEMLKDAVAPNRPWFARRRGWYFAALAAAAVPPLVFLALLGGVIEVGGLAGRALEAGAILLAYAAPFGAMWLLPSLEIHGGTPRYLRFAWVAVVQLLWPAAAAVISARL